MEELKSLQNDREWLLFELLEGNLNPEEAEALKAHIETDADLKAEWELLKETILPQPELIYPDRSRFHKKSYPAKILLPLFASQTVRFAASFGGLLLIGYFLFNAWKDAPVTALDPAPWKSVEGGSAGQNALVSGNSAGELSAQERASEPVESTFSETEHIPGTLPSHLNPGTDVPHIAQGSGDVGQILTLQPAPLNYSAFNKVGLRMELPDHLPAIFNLDPWNSRYYVIEDQTASNLPGLRGMLDQGLALLAQPIRNTHVHLLRDSETQKPTLKISYEGVHYQALAMLELKFPEAMSTKQ